jgi:hypothetical protein
MLGTGSWKRMVTGSHTPKPSWITPPRQEQAAEQAAKEALAGAAMTAPVPIVIAPEVPPSKTPPRPPVSVPPPASIAASERELALTREVESLRAQLAATRAEVAQARNAVLAILEPEVVELACAIAERIIDAEVATDGALFSRWAREGLAALGDPTNATIAVAPDLARNAEAAQLSAIAPLVTDQALPPGHCEVRAGAAAIEVGARARVAAMRETLGGDKL